MTSRPTDTARTPANDALEWLDRIEGMQGGANGPTIKLRAAILAMSQPAPTAVELGRVARALALEYAELRHEAMRALVAWDGTVLPKAHDGMMQERMECLREALDIGQSGTKP